MSFDANTPYQHPSPSQSPEDNPSTAQELQPPPTLHPSPTPAFTLGIRNDDHSMLPGGPQASGLTTGSALEHVSPPLPAGAPMGPPPLFRSGPCVDPAGTASGLAPSRPASFSSAATPIPTHLQRGGLPPAPLSGSARYRSVDHSFRETMKGGFETLRKELRSQQDANTARLELDASKQRRKGKGKGKGKGTSAARQPLQTCDGNAPASGTDADIESNADAASEADVHFDISPASTHALQKALRAILAHRAGIDSNMRVHPRIYELEYVAAVSQSPFHPATYEPHPTDKPIPAGDRPPGAESPFRKLRFNYPAGPEQESNRTYIEEIAVFFKSRGHVYGLHPEVTLSAIVALIVARFVVQAGEHQRWLKDPNGFGRNRQNEAARKKDRLEMKASARGQIASAATGQRRSVSSSPGKFGSEGPSSDSDVDGKLADFRAAYHFDCQSAEDTDPSPPPVGIPNAKVLRCRRPAWGSAQLHIVKRRGDKYRSRQYHVTDSENELEFLGSELPSTVQRWMVKEEFAAAHPEACSKVLLNHGPFLGETPSCAQAVIGGPEEWGSSMPPRKRRKTNTGEVLEERMHPLALTFRLPFECSPRNDVCVTKPSTASASPANSNRPLAPESPPTGLTFDRTASSGWPGPSTRLPDTSPSQSPGQPMHLPHASPVQSPGQSVYLPHASPSQSPGQRMYLPHASPSQSPGQPMYLPHASPSQSPGQPMYLPHASPSQSPGQPMYLPHASPSQSEPMYPSQVSLASPASPAQSLGQPHASLSQLMGWALPENSQLGSYSQESSGLDSRWTSSSQGSSSVPGPSLASSQVSTFSTQGQTHGQDEFLPWQSQGQSQGQSQEDFLAWTLTACATGPATASGGYEQSASALTKESGGDQPGIPAIDLAGLTEDDSLENISVAEYLRRQRRAQAASQN
ncbi:hypothetical protein OC844_006046 [Tilletia horrida]|nr:hypothetical protein OC844_006046 [Tilletia horrida]